LQKLVDLGRVYEKRFEYHLLGVYNNPAEIKKEAEFDWVRCVDTASPIQNGLLGIRFDLRLGLPQGKHRKDDKLFFSSTLKTPLQRKEILLNMEKFKGWAKNENVHCE